MRLILKRQSGQVLVLEPGVVLPGKLVVDNEATQLWGTLAPISPNVVADLTAWEKLWGIVSVRIVQFHDVVAYQFEGEAAYTVPPGLGLVALEHRSVVLTEDHMYLSILVQPAYGPPLKEGSKLVPFFHRDWVTAYGLNRKTALKVS